MNFNDNLWYVYNKLYLSYASTIKLQQYNKCMSFKIREKLLFVAASNQARKWYRRAWLHFSYDNMIDKIINYDLSQFVPIWPQLYSEW